MGSHLLDFIHVVHVPRVGRRRPLFDILDVEGGGPHDPYFSFAAGVAPISPGIRERCESRDEALDLVSKNPGLLFCKPSDVKDSPLGQAKMIAGAMDFFRFGK